MVVQLGAIPDAGATALLDGEGATLELALPAAQLQPLVLPQPSQT